LVIFRFISKMSTINQLCNNQRKRKVKKIKVPALSGNPLKKGICVKLFTRAPKKPNSAIRSW